MKSTECQTPAIKPPISHNLVNWFTASVVFSDKVIETFLITYFRLDVVHLLVLALMLRITCPSVLH